MDLLLISATVARIVSLRGTRVNCLPNLQTVLTEPAGETVNVVPLDGFVRATSFTFHTCFPRSCTLARSLGPKNFQ